MKYGIDFSCRWKNESTITLHTHASGCFPNHQENHHNTRNIYILSQDIQIECVTETERKKQFCKKLKKEGNVGYVHDNLLHCYACVSVMLLSKVWHSGRVLYLVCMGRLATPCLDTSGVGGLLASMLIFNRSHCRPSALEGLVARLLVLLSDTCRRNQGLIRD